jgi:hypothetical protein
MTVNSLGEREYHGSFVCASSARGATKRLKEQGRVLQEYSERID